METNQYDLVLAMAQFIRKNPDSPTSKRLKECKNQADQESIFIKEVIENVKKECTS